MDYRDKSNTELIKIMNDLSDENEKIKSEVDKLLVVIEDIEARHAYIKELIKNRLKK
jgi:hypothetical protein